MELHSYAKRKLYHKWTIEHKRRLVEMRIQYDAIFNKRYYNIQESWCKVVRDAKLNGFTALFVRKQWATMLIKYKNLTTRHTVDGKIDDDTQKLISSEWEFFDAIHTFMQKKEINLHSYAQSPLDEDEDLGLPTSKENSPERESNNNPKPDTQPETGSNSEITPETSNDIEPSQKESRVQQISENDDHDYFAVHTAKPGTSGPKKTKRARVETQNQQPSEAMQNDKPEPSSSEKRLSYKEKYYRHKIKLEKRWEQKMSSLLDVFGQVVKQEYPTIDVTKLLCKRDQQNQDTGSSA